MPPCDDPDPGRVGAAGRGSDGAKARGQKTLAAMAAPTLAWGFAPFHAKQFNLSTQCSAIHAPLAGPVPWTERGAPSESVQVPQEP